jgi:type I restriction enzyme S subunit
VRDWQTAPLGDVCEIVGGGTPSRSVAEYFNGDIPWITPTDVTKKNDRYLEGGANTITDIGLRNSSARLLPPRSVMLTSRATIGYTAINTVPVTTNQGFANFICGDRIFPEYLAHWLEWSRDALINLASGATFKEINKSTLKKLPIPLPPLDEQRRIVGLLDRAAEIRRRADAARAKSRAIIPALFLDSFGDPATNPKGWPVVTLGDLEGMELRNGISPSKAGKVSGNVLTLSAITRGAFDPSARKDAMFAGPLAADQTVSKSLFLICRGNGNRALVGQGAFPLMDMPGVAFPDTMIALRLPEHEVAPAYLAAAWSTDHVRAQIDAAAKTTNGTFKISQSGILRFSFPLPPRALQVGFGERASRLETLYRHLDAAAAKAEAMAAGLSAEVFGASPNKGNGHG